jgi:hypothetical protein
MRAFEAIDTDRGHGEYNLLGCNNVKISLFTHGSCWFLVWITLVPKMETMHSSETSVGNYENNARLYLSDGKVN